MISNKTYKNSGQATPVLMTDNLLLITPHKEGLWNT